MNWLVGGADQGGILVKSGFPVEKGFPSGMERGGSGCVECVGGRHGFPRKAISIMMLDGGVQQSILLKCMLFVMYLQRGGWCTVIGGCVQRPLLGT